MDDLEEAGRVTARSSLYRTEPVGEPAQPPFVNAAALVRTERDPERLLAFLLELERRYGRDRRNAPPKGPRTLDLDLLLMDDLVLVSPRLILPHPALIQRRFVLEPLSEIAPELRYPVAPGDRASGATMAELLAALPDEGPNRRDAVRKLPCGEQGQRIA